MHSVVNSQSKIPLLDARLLLNRVFNVKVAPQQAWVAVKHGHWPERQTLETTGRMKHRELGLQGSQC